jgi:hypothetical protein
MASELRVNTLKDAAGANSVAMTYVAGGSAKAWIKYNGTGTIAISDSFNVASITDETTGTTTITLTSSFSNANYSTVATCSDTGAHMQIVDANQAAGSYRQRTLDGSLSLVDDPAVYGNAHGDLA